MKLAIGAMVALVMGTVAICGWELGAMRLEQRLQRDFVLKKDLDNLVMQANAVVSAHAAAIKELQQKSKPTPEEVK